MKMHTVIRKEVLVLMDLKLALIRQGIRQTRMAVDLGWDPAKISRIINGIVQPKREDRLAISRYLNLPEQPLFGEMPELGAGDPPFEGKTDRRKLDMAMKQRLYTGFFSCPACGVRYDIEDVPEEDVICEECGAELESEDYDEEDE